MAEENEQDQKVAVVQTVIPEIETMLALNGGLLSAETRAELETMKSSKVKAAEEFIKETGGKLEREVNSGGKEQEEGEEQEELEEEEEVEGNGEGNGEGSESQEEGEESEESPNEDESEEAPEGSENKNPLGLSFGKKEKSEKKFAIQKPEDILPAINKQYGLKLKDIKDIPKFFETVNKFREGSQKLAESEKTASNYKALFEGLDEPLLNAVKAYYAGGDYTKVITEKPVFDFKLDADKQDPKKLVSTFFKDKITQEQIDKIGTDEQDPATAIAIEASKDKYNAEKQRRDSDFATRENQAKESAKLFSTSVEGSITHMKQSFPKVDPAVEARVKQIMTGGQRKVLEIFFNPDGTFKPGAAEQIVLAQDGKAVIEEMMQAAGRQAESRTNEEIVSRGANGKRKKNNGGGGNSGISPALKHELAKMEKLKKPVNI